MDCIFESNCDLQPCKFPYCMKYKEMKFLLDNSNIPKAKQCVNELEPEDCDIKAFEKLADIRDNILEFVTQGKDLYIYSEICGNGKTTWSIKLMLQFFNEVWAGNGFVERGIFINVPTFLSKIKSTISNPDLNFEKLKENLTITDLVIFDDISSTKLSEYDYTTLLSFIDVRALNCKSCFYTGNTNSENLVKFLGDRLASRVCGRDTYKVVLKGKDRR